MKALRSYMSKHGPESILTYLPLGAVFGGTLFLGHWIDAFSGGQPFLFGWHLGLFVFSSLAMTICLRLVIPRFSRRDDQRH